MNARVIAATNCNLPTAIEQGRFREDLFYRLQVVSIEVPPLRKRGEDILLLAEAMLARCANEAGEKLLGFTRRALVALEDHTWPGNVRELENRIKRAVVMAAGPRVTPEDLELTSPAAEHDRHTLKEIREHVEKDVIQRELAKHRGNVTRTAAKLGVSRPTLHELLARYGLQRTHRGIKAATLRLQAADDPLSVPMYCRRILRFSRMSAEALKQLFSMAGLSVGRRQHRTLSDRFASSMRAMSRCRPPTAGSRTKYVAVTYRLPFPSNHRVTGRSRHAS